MIKREGERAKKACAWVGWEVGAASWLPTHKAKFFISGMVTTGWRWATPSHRGLKPRRFISHSWHTCTYGCVGGSTTDVLHPGLQPRTLPRILAGDPKALVKLQWAPNGLARIGPHTALAKANLMATTNFQQMKEIPSTQKESQNACEQLPINFVPFCSNPNIKPYYSGYSLWRIFMSVFDTASGEFVL